MIFFNISGKGFKFCFDGIPLGRHCMGSRHLEGPGSQNTYSCCRWTRARLHSGTLPACCSTPPADCWGPSPAASHSAGSARSCTTGSASTHNTPCPPGSSLFPSSQTSTSTEPSWVPCSLNNRKYLTMQRSPVFNSKFCDRRTSRIQLSVDQTLSPINK